MEREVNDKRLCALLIALAIMCWKIVVINSLPSTIAYCCALVFVLFLYVKEILSTKKVRKMAIAIIVLSFISLIQNLFIIRLMCYM